MKKNRQIEEEEREAASRTASQIGADMHGMRSDIFFTREQGVLVFIQAGAMLAGIIADWMSDVHICPSLYACFSIKALLRTDLCCCTWRVGGSFEPVITVVNPSLVCVGSSVGELRRR